MVCVWCCGMLVVCVVVVVVVDGVVVIVVVLVPKLDAEVFLVRENLVVHFDQHVAMAS